MKVLLRILSGALTGVMAVVLVATVALAITARRSEDRIPSVMGYKVLSVISGSMEPAIMTGDVIIVEPLKPEQQIAEGDVITFRAKDKPDMLITHRVTGIISVNGQPAAFVTKGDNNDTEDLSTVARSQIVGIQRWRVPYYGYISNFVRTPVGVVLLVIVPGVALIGLEIRKLIKAVMEEEAAKKDKADTAEANSPS